MVQMAPFEWTVIGAGPAGTAAVGKLLDQGIEPASVAWVDPAFAGGDLGGKWRTVSSNTQVGTFLSYLNGSAAFGFAAAPPTPLGDLDPHDTCDLGLVADPLVWITERLRERVGVFETTATAQSLQQNRWRIETRQGELISTNVILAVGAVPKKLSYPHLKEIPIEVAVDPDKLAQLPLDNATVAVFGSSHSTMITLPHLLHQPVKRVLNFYRSPLKYAVYQDDWILFDDTGLKGHAADWARENIDGVLPDKLERRWTGNDNFADKVAECDHVVYTVGFERRTLPEVKPWGQLDYNATNGIIAPGLFGLGIAFPSYGEDPYGYGQYRVGLKKFMDHINAVLPLWLGYPP
jgi:cation diffusion facilitator CzcD-associated flavoprotein CzcO